jgi:hypothetical protein
MKAKAVSPHLTAQLPDPARLVPLSTPLAIKAAAFYAVAAAKPKPAKPVPRSVGKAQAQASAKPKPPPIPSWPSLMLSLTGHTHDNTLKT